MEIIVQNWPNPGAHFTSNTNSVILSVFEWITNNDDLFVQYSELQDHLDKADLINKSNFRNICALLKGCGFVQYESKVKFHSKSFFTELGKGYIYVLQMLDALDQIDEYTEEQRTEARNKFTGMQSEIIFRGLLNLVHKVEPKYGVNIALLAKYILLYRKISKHEFGLLQHFVSQFPDTWETDMKDTLEGYRAGTIPVGLKVSVRNDKEKHIAGAKSTTIKGDNYLACYTYYVGLFKEAGLIQDKGEYNIMDDSAENKLEQLAEAYYDK